MKDIIINFKEVWKEDKKEAFNGILFIVGFPVMIYVMCKTLSILEPIN